MVSRPEHLPYGLSTNYISSVGSGIWVNSDDGVIRGVEAATGKVVASLKGHEAGAKIRCLFAGTVENEEVLVSGGFDQRLIFWKAEAKVG